MKLTADAGVSNCVQEKEFCVYGSVHRWSILIIVQRDATQSSLFIILQVHSTCFGCQPHPSSGVHKTVNTASGTGHIFRVATSFPRGQASLATLEGGSYTKIWLIPEAVVTAWPRWKEEAAQKMWPVPEAVVTAWPRWKEVAAQKYDPYRRL